MVKNFSRHFEKKPEKIMWLLTEWSVFHGYDLATRWIEDLSTVTKVEMENFIKVFENPVREGTLIIRPEGN